MPHALTSAGKQMRACALWAAATVLAIVGAVQPAGAAPPKPHLGMNEVRSGTFEAPDGTKLEIDEVYKAHLSLRKPHHLRNLYWQVGILGIGTIWYWTNAIANSTDWEYEDADFAARFKADAIRFDNNSFTINHLAHPTAGGGYYLASRVHNYGVGMSSLISFASSFIWEAGLEWRERISINDMIFTPGAGIAMGESYYRLSHYLNSAPDGGNWLHKTFAWLIGWPVAVNRWIDGVEPVNDGLEDRLGFSAAYAHRFRVSAQVANESGDRAGDAGALAGFRLEGDIYAVPGFKRPGTFAMLFSDGNFTEFDTSFWWNDSGVAMIDLNFHSVVVGYYQQSYEGTPDTLTGSAGRFAMGFAFEHVQRWLPEPRDRRAILHLPGGELKIWHAWEGLIHDLEVTLNPDFSAIDSISFPTWKLNNFDETERSVLERQGYYFGFGGTARIESTLRYRGLALRGRLRLTYSNGIEDLDREEEAITSQSPIEDTIVEAFASLGYTEPSTRLSGRIEARRINRVGRLDNAQLSRGWTHLGFSFGSEF